MLDYYLRRYGKSTSGTSTKLLKVKLEPVAAPAPSFTLVLSNGRRIETAWNFIDTELARLIRIAEDA